MAWVETISTDSLGVREMTQVRMEDGYRIALIRLEDGYYAIDDTCTHAEASLAEGKLLGNRVKCPLHGAEFEIQTGAVKSFPAVVGVKQYDTKIKNGTLLINYGD